jgi:hypothetical protein
MWRWSTLPVPERHMVRGPVRQGLWSTQTAEAPRQSGQSGELR